MKTPREILFARHRSAEPKLDAVRRSVVAAVAARSADSLVRANRVKTDSRTTLSALHFCWREFILPRPRAWAGLATAWVVILALRFSTPDQSHSVAGKSSMPPEVIAELQQQKHLYTELAGLPQLPDMKPSKPFLPRPRSARRSEIFAV